MEGKEGKAPFEVDLKQLVEDLSNYKNKVTELETKLGEVESERDTYKTQHETLTTKYEEVEKKNGELYLQVAQSIVEQPTKIEQIQEEPKVSVADLCSDLLKGL